MKSAKPKADSLLTRFFTHFAATATRWTGSPVSFILAVLLILVWAGTGPVFNYSENWQLIINTGTTIITFLMVFVIQQSQNRDTTAIHIKLNELIATNELASNRLVCVEELSEGELELLRKFYHELNDLSKKHHDLYSTHSVDEAEQNHQSKLVRKSKTTKRSETPARFGTKK